MLSRQLAFDLPVKAALGRADFLVAPSNALAVASIEASGDWPQGKLVLIGPQGSGKSHLAQVWAAETGAAVLLADALPLADLEHLPTHAVIVEDADRISQPAAEVAFFHLHNLVMAAGGRLLITAQTPPNRWKLNLPDLASRMQGSPTTILNAPDDALLSAVLVKLFADRQLAVPLALIPYLVGRMERSHDAAQGLVAELDRRALAERRPVTLRLAAEVLDRRAETAR